MSKTITQKTDNELARAALQGGRAEFEEIFRRYSIPLTSFAIGRTLNIHDAEDIVQQTFLRAYQNLKSFDESYSLRNWLFTIAYRLIVSEYRKKRPQQLTQEALTRLSSGTSDSNATLWIWEEAYRLGPESFTVLWLFYKQDMTTSEIAHVMKKTKIMVRVLLHRVRKRLAKQIATRTENAQQVNLVPSHTVFFERTK